MKHTAVLFSCYYEARPVGDYLDRWQRSKARRRILLRATFVSKSSAARQETVSTESAAVSRSQHYATTVFHMHCGNSNVKYWEIFDDVGIVLAVLLVCEIQRKSGFLFLHIKTSILAERSGIPRTLKLLLIPILIIAKV